MKKTIFLLIILYSCSKSHKHISLLQDEYQEYKDLVKVTKELAVLKGEKSAYFYLDSIRNSSEETRISQYAEIEQLNYIDDDSIKSALLFRMKDGSLFKNGSPHIKYLIGRHA